MRWSSGGDRRCARISRARSRFRCRPAESRHSSRQDTALVASGDGCGVTVDLEQDGCQPHRADLPEDRCPDACGGEPVRDAAPPRRRATSEAKIGRTPHESRPVSLYGARMHAPARSVRWVARNVTIGGFSPSAAEARPLGVAVRFSTGVSLAMLIVALVSGSVPLLLALGCFGAAGGFASRHPLDVEWDHGVRHLLWAPALRPNPPRRWRARRIAGVVLFNGATLLAVRASRIALALVVVQALGSADGAPAKPAGPTPAASSTRCCG